MTVSHPARASIRSLGVLMRTPGDDRGPRPGIAPRRGRGADDGRCGLGRVAGHGGSIERAGDTAHVALAATVPAKRCRTNGRLPTTSACGLCGRLSVQALDRGRARQDARSDFRPRSSRSLPGRLRAGQAVFAETGGLHAAALFDESGERVALAEDVGRHNAVDKVVGALLRSGRLPATNDVLVVSGRVAFEIVQKAAMAGVAAVVAVGAPSNLAVDAARAAGLTLVGFVREGQFNVYAGGERVISSATSETPRSPSSRHR